MYGIPKWTNLPEIMLSLGAVTIHVHDVTVIVNLVSGAQMAACISEPFHSIIQQGLLASGYCQ